MTEYNNELKSDTFNIKQELKTYCYHFKGDVWRGYCC